MSNPKNIGLPAGSVAAPHAHNGVAWRKINHLVMAFALGIILTAAVFLAAPIGKQANPGRPIYTDRQSAHRRADAASNARTTDQANTSATNQADLAKTTRGPNSSFSAAQAAAQRANAATNARTAGPAANDPQEQLRQIQAINEYNRRLTQGDSPAAPIDPSMPNAVGVPARPIDPTMPDTPRQPIGPTAPHMPPGLPQQPSPYGQ